MSKLSTENRTKNEQSHPDATRQSHPDATHSINQSNKYYINNTRTDNGDSDTYEIRANNYLFFLEEVVSYIAVEMERLETEEKRAIDAEQVLQNEYTEACTQQDVAKIQAMAPKLSHSERKRKQCGDDAGNIKKAFRRYDYSLGRTSYIHLNSYQIEKIGKTLKDALPEFPAKQIQNAAFNVLMNSVICDLKSEYAATFKQTDWRISNREQIAMDNAIDNCLKRVVVSNNYRLNPEVDFGIYSKNVKKHQQKHDAEHWMN